jgi:hypothetical protein
VRPATAIYAFCTKSQITFTDSAEGEHFWYSLDELRAMPKEAFSSSADYTFSPLFHEFGKYSEAYIPWSKDESDWKRYYI